MGDVLPDKSVLDRHVTVLFRTLLLVGIVLRLAASVLSQGFVHPDEHQQYLEVAQGIVYGPHISWWEYERGTRHYFYPSCLALLLYSLDLIGIRDPLYQATIIRSLLSITIFVSFALLARDWLRQGRTPAALCLLALAALSPDIIYMSIRTLSETAATIPFVLSILFIKRDPFLTGFLLGAMFAVRFQAAFFIPGFLALNLYDDWSARQCWKGSTCRLTAGLTISLFAAGLMDKLTWGRWFHSPLECFQANIIEGIAARFGMAPWYQYLDWAAEFLAEAVPLLGLVLVVLGVVRERRLAFLGLLFLIGHSVIDRKAPRFLWPLAPIGLMVFAAGFEVAYHWLPERWGRAILVTVFVFSLADGSLFRFENLDWEPEPSRSSSLALAKVGQYPDVTGVLVLNLPSFECGNYFYLRRDVPLLVESVSDPSDITSHPLWVQGTINYVIAWPKDTAIFAIGCLEEIEIVHGLGIYKVKRVTRFAMPTSWICKPVQVALGELPLKVSLPGPERLRRLDVAQLGVVGKPVPVVVALDMDPVDLCERRGVEVIVNRAALHVGQMRPDRIREKEGQAMHLQLGKHQERTGEQQRRPQSRPTQLVRPRESPLQRVNSGQGQQGEKENKVARPVGVFPAPERQRLDQSESEQETNEQKSTLAGVMAEEAAGARQGQQQQGEVDEEAPLPADQEVVEHVPNAVRVVPVPPLVIAAQQGAAELELMHPRLGCQQQQHGEDQRAPGEGEPGGARQPFLPGQDCESRCEHRHEQQVGHAGLAQQSQC